MKPALLEGTDIGKRFGGLRVFTKVGFGIGEGEIVALIGPNGAVKPASLGPAIAGISQWVRKTLARLAEQQESEPCMHL